MDPNAQVLEGVIKTLIYGVTSVSAQSEEAIGLLADYIREKYPEVAILLEKSRYVDDQGESKATKEEIYLLIKHANEAFALVSLIIKEWVASGEVPSEKVSKDGVSVDIGGMSWFPVLDTLQNKIPPLHFGQKKRGLLGKDVKIFGSFGLTKEETLNLLDDFVPRKLSKRNVASKKASLFDIMGKLSPITISSTVLMRNTFKSMAGAGWDDAISAELRRLG